MSAGRNTILILLGVILALCLLVALMIPQYQSVRAPMSERAPASEAPSDSMQEEEAMDEAMDGAFEDALEDAMEAPAEEAAEDEAELPMSAPADDDTGGGAAPAPAGPDSAFTAYTVRLEAEGELRKPGPEGTLSVWIGDDAYMPAATPGLSSDTATIHDAGQGSAQVYPFSTGIAFNPPKGDCQVLSREGTISRFRMTPQQTGTFPVSADVYLFPSTDCTGTPVPRSGTTLQVTVKINKGGVVTSHVGELWDIFWKELVEFWGWLVAFVFFVLAFVIRALIKRRLKKDGIDLPDAGGPTPPADPGAPT